MYFFVPFSNGTFCIILHHFLLVNTFLKYFLVFSKIFFYCFLLSFISLFSTAFPLFVQPFGRNKKLVIAASLFSFFLLLIHIFLICFHFRDFVLFILPFLFHYVNTFLLEIFTFFIVPFILCFPFPFCLFFSW